MVAECATLRGMAVRDAVPGPDVWLVLRRHIEAGELKTALCKAPGDTALAALVRMSGMRWPIATCCEDGKQLLGMGDDAVRSWPGWHHHMTLCSDGRQDYTPCIRSMFGRKCLINPQQDTVSGYYDGKNS